MPGAGFPDAWHRGFSRVTREWQPPGLLALVAGNKRDDGGKHRQGGCPWQGAEGPQEVEAVGRSLLLRPL